MDCCLLFILSIRVLSGYQMSFLEKRIIKDKRGCRITAVVPEDKSPLMLDDPFWVPDCKSQHCSNCHAKFTTIRRRHHCRRCGLCFCDSCSKSYPLLRMGFVDPVLQCPKCTNLSRAEIDFFKFAIPALEVGTEIYVENYDGIFFARLTANHQNIILTDPQNSLHTERIPLTSILSVMESFAGDQRSLVDLPVIELEFTGNMTASSRTMKLIAVAGHQRFVSQTWLRNLKKAILLINPT